MDYLPNLKNTEEGKEVCIDTQLVKLIGTSAAYLYNILKNWTKERKEIRSPAGIPDDWIRASLEDVAEVSGLSRNVQLTTTNNLKRYNLIEVKVAGLPGTRYIKVNPLEQIDLTKNKQKQNKEGYIYYIHTSAGVKIGRTNYPNKRYKVIETKLPVHIVHTDVFKVNNMISAEKELHKIFDNKRGLGEWFNMSITDLELGEKVLKDKYEGSRDNNTPYENILQLIEEEKKNNT